LFGYPTDDGCSLLPHFTFGCLVRCRVDFTRTLFVLTHTFIATHTICPYLPFLSIYICVYVCTFTLVALHALCLRYWLHTLILLFTFAYVYTPLLRFVERLHLRLCSYVYVFVYALRFLVVHRCRWVVLHTHAVVYGYIWILRYGYMLFIYVWLLRLLVVIPHSFRLLLPLLLLQVRLQVTVTFVTCPVLPDPICCCYVLLR